MRNNQCGKYFVASACGMGCGLVGAFFINHLIDNAVSSDFSPRCDDAACVAGSVAVITASVAVGFQFGKWLMDSDTVPSDQSAYQLQV